MKRSIEKRERREIRLKPPQWKVFLCAKRFRVLVAGRRFGKTYLALAELIRAAWGPGRKAWYVAPSYRQAKRVAWLALKRMTKPYWASKPNETRFDDRVDLRWLYLLARRRQLRLAPGRGS
jgi:hypothetical protein